MADPTSPLNAYSKNSCVDDGSEPDTPIVAQSSVVPEPPGASSDQAGASTEIPPGTPGLVQKFSTPTSFQSKKPSASSSSPPTTGFLVTSSGAVPGGGSYRVAASLYRDEVQRGPREGIVAEVGTVSVQYGKDNDVQLVGIRETLRMSRGGYGLSLTNEVGVVRANLGEHNDDGSVGGNIGSGAEAFGGEATLDTPAESLTGGLSVSMSVSGSLGVRDADHDGAPEYCAKFSVPAFTLGACVERFW